MRKIQSITCFGYLPAGLVLNTALISAPKVTEQGREVVYLTPKLVGGAQTVQVPQASNITMIVPDGEFLTPVALHRLGTPEELDDVTNSFDVNPMSDPCLLMTSVLFKGTLVVYSGKDIPKSAIRKVITGATSSSTNVSWYVPVQSSTTMLVAPDGSMSVSEIVSIFSKGYGGVTWTSMDPTTDAFKTLYLVDGAEHENPGLVLAASGFRLTKRAFAGMPKIQHQHGQQTHNIYCVEFSTYERVQFYLYPDGLDTPYVSTGDSQQVFKMAGMPDLFMPQVLDPTDNTILSPTGVGVRNFEASKSLQANL